MGGLPPQQLAGHRARCRAPSAKNPAITPKCAAPSWCGTDLTGDVEVAADEFGDIAGGHSLLGDAVQHGCRRGRTAGELEQALAIYRDLGIRPGQANALLVLGAVRREMSDYHRAAGELEQALAIYRDLPDRGAEITALNEIGTLHRLSGEPAEADACHQQAL